METMHGQYTIRALRAGMIAVMYGETVIAQYGTDYADQAPAWAGETISPALVERVELMWDERYGDE